MVVTLVVLSVDIVLGGQLHSWHDPYLAPPDLTPLLLL